VKKIVDTVKLVYIIYTIIFFILYFILLCLLLGRTVEYSKFLWNHTGFLYIWYFVTAVWTYGTGVLMILKSIIHLVYSEYYYEEKKLYSVLRLLAAVLILIFSQYIMYIFAFPVFNG
jgi:hypothetical protein